MNTASWSPLERLAMGSNCHRCGAYADEVCRTQTGRVTRPHQARVDRAVRQYQARKA